jgi:hypothetical protein
MVKDAQPSLTQLLTEVPEELFWNLDRNPPAPAYNRVFAEILRRLLDLPDHDAVLPLREVYAGRVPNLSSFQRAAAKEASRRRAVPPKPPSIHAPHPIEPTTISDATRQAATQALGPSVARAFLAHATRTPPPSPELLGQEVDGYLAELKDELSRNEFLDLPLAKQIAANCHRLIARSGELSSADYQLVVGAVGYFLDADDEAHDLLSPVGFDDDEEVVTWVLTRLTGNSR